MPRAPLQSLWSITALVAFGALPFVGQQGRLRVPVRAPLGERGPTSCPSALRPVLGALDAPDSRVRLAARWRLAGVNWRHAGWIEREVRRGSPERRLALAFVLRRLRDRRYMGQPAEPIPADERDAPRQASSPEAPSGSGSARRQ